MSKSLQRLLKLRELDEEDCRSKLASECELLNGIEADLAATGRENLDARSTVFHSISNNLPAERVEDEGITQITELLLSSLKGRLKEQQAKVEVRRERYLESRIHRLQLGRLLSEQEQARKNEEIRRQQSSLDDWFNHSKRRKEDLRFSDQNE